MARCPRSGGSTRHAIPAFRRCRKPRIDPSGADRRELATSIYERNAPALPGRDPQCLKALLEGMSSYAQRPHPRRILAPEPHHASGVKHRAVEPPVPAWLPAESSVIKFEDFRYVPPHALRDHGTRPRYQTDSSLKSSDVEVSQPDARHRILPCLDDRTGNLIDPPCPGRADPLCSQPARDGISPAHRRESPDRRGIEARVVDASRRLEIDFRQRIEQLGGLPAKICGTHQRRPYARPPRLENRYHHPPQRDSRESLILVGGVVDRREAGIACVRP